MTTTTAIAKPDGNGAPAAPDAMARLLELVVVQGDLSKLSPGDRVSYYRAVCESAGLNPLTRPFDYIWLPTDDGGDKKLTLYAKKDCAEQLRRKHGISLTIVSRERQEDVYIVTARATVGRDDDARTDESTGVVSLKRWDRQKNELLPISGERLANLMMKAETKAKRRVTLSICGLGFLDESEVVDIPGATPGEQPPATDAQGASAEALGADKRAEEKGQAPPTYDSMHAITMLAELGNGSVQPAAVEHYFGPGVKNKTHLDKLKAEKEPVYRAGYEKLHADHAQGKAGWTAAGAAA